VYVEISNLKFATIVARTLNKNMSSPKQQVLIDENIGMMKSYILNSTKSVILALCFQKFHECGLHPCHV
jgi:hypothetical protein